MLDSYFGNPLKLTFKRFKKYEGQIIPDSATIAVFSLSCKCSIKSEQILNNTFMFKCTFIIPRYYHPVLLHGNKHF